MIPVDEGNISEDLAFSSFAVAAHTALQSRKPRLPVAQFAFPEFTTTARTRPPVWASAARPTSIGAATTRFFVNSAAAELRRSARIIARSGRPLALMPAVTEENL